MISSYIECPCCGYYSVSGHGDICEVCFWEFDGFTEYRGETVSDSNGMTLNEAKDNYVNLGAIEERFLNRVIPYEARKKYQISEEGLRLNKIALGS